MEQCTIPCCKQLGAAAQGRLAAALEYLDLVPGEATSSTAELRDRICRSGAHDLPAGESASPDAGARSG